jgi:hypothetical protein
MRDHTSLDGPFDSCIDCVLAVDCPTHQTKAEITVARWKAGSGQFTPWTVVDCSLLPAGHVSCHVGCLALLTDKSRLGWRKRGRAE